MSLLSEIALLIFLMAYSFYRHYRFIESRILPKRQQFKTHRTHISVTSATAVTLMNKESPVLESNLIDQEYVNSVIKRAA